MEQEIRENKKFVLDVNEKPKHLYQWFLWSLQHVLAMFVACTLVPMIVYAGYKGLDGALLSNEMIASTVLSAGVGTIFYLIVTKMKSPIFLASSFAYMAPMEEAIALGTIDGKANLWVLPIGMAFVGLVYVAVALCIKKFGVDWLNKLLPPVVIGPVIMVIGLSLSSSAISNLTQNGSGTYNLLYIFCGLVAMFATALAAHYGKGMISLIPFIIGILAGYAMAAILTGIGYYAAGNDYFKIVNWDPLINNQWTSLNGWLSVPKFIWDEPHVAVTWENVGQAAVLFIPVSLVTVCEHIGDHKNLSNILDKDLLKDPGLDKTLTGDGVATAISGCLSGVANTTYGENVAVVGTTKIASSWVVLNAAIMCVALSFLTPMMALTMTIPSCVTGGVSLILYGFIAASGVKMLIADQIDFGKTKNIFVASAILVTGIGGLVLNFFGKVQITSIAVSMILGIVLNAILKDPSDIKAKEDEKLAEKTKDDPKSYTDLTSNQMVYQTSILDSSFKVSEKYQPEAMTFYELRSYAKILGIQNYRNMNKESLLSSIKEKAIENNTLYNLEKNKSEVSK